MKKIEMLAFMTAVAVAAAAWLGVAMSSATTVDCGASACKAGTDFHANAESETELLNKVTLHPPIGTVECAASTTTLKLQEQGVGPNPAKASVSELSFEVCNATVKVLQTGSWDIHTDYTVEENGLVQIRTTSNNVGTVTSTGMEVTIELSGFHCIFKTNSTLLGRLTGSAVTKGTATLDIGATIPRTGGRSGAFCGSTAQMTGAYQFTSPGTLDIT
ncbi:MAG TPA: hypothetical protein VFX44_06490 [Solirubrobacterales bacterium]|nr:hypothetical protein [Solirubrobacterales bacterium]